MHAISGCDATGHIQTKSKKTWFNVFIKSSDDVLDALANIGFRDEPSPDVVKGCEKFICKLFSAEFSDADKLRWHLFKHLTNHKVLKTCHLHLDQLNREFTEHTSNAMNGTLA